MNEVKPELLHSDIKSILQSNFPPISMIRLIHSTKLPTVLNSNFSKLLSFEFTKESSPRNIEVSHPAQESRSVFYESHPIEVGRVFPIPNKLTSKMRIYKDIITGKLWLKWPLNRGAWNIVGKQQKRAENCELIFLPHIHVSLSLSPVPPNVLPSRTFFLCQFFLRHFSTCEVSGSAFSRGCTRKILFMRRLRTCPN